MSVLSVGRQTVTTAGTPVQLTSSQNSVIGLTITAETDNTGIIVVGDSSVVAALATRKGTPLAAGDSVSFAEKEVDQLSDVYLDTTVNTDGVTYTASVAN